MQSTRFDWDENKDRENQSKHGVPFALAQHAFFDPQRVIAADEEHSNEEERFYCIGKVDERIVTVRFTYRGDIIRILGAEF